MTSAGAAPRLFWGFSVGQGLAAAGEIATLTALTIHLQTSGGTVWVTALTICSFLPAVLLAAPASRLFDRFPPRGVLLVSMSLRVLLTVTVALTLASPTVALATYILVRSVSVPESPAVLAAGAGLAAGRWPVRTVYSRLAISRNIGAVTGPAVAGVVMLQFGPHSVLLLDAAACTLLLGCLLVVRLRLFTDQTPGVPHQLPPARYQLSELVVRSTASPYVAVLALAIVFTAALPVSQAAYFNDELGLSPSDYGFIIAAYSSGRLIAALLGSLTSWPRSSSVALVGATIGMGVALVLATLVSVVWAIVAVLAVAGYCNTLQVLSIRTIVHEGTDERRLPQAFTALGAVNNAATLLGTIGGAALVVAMSGQLALQLAGTATVLVGTLGPLGARLQRRRQARTDEPNIDQSHDKTSL